jgi:hypothetical protein
VSGHATPVPVSQEYVPVEPEETPMTPTLSQQVSFAVQHRVPQGFAQTPPLELALLPELLVELPLDDVLPLLPMPLLEVELPLVLPLLLLVLPLLPMPLLLDDDFPPLELLLALDPLAPPLELDPPEVPELDPLVLPEPDDPELAPLEPELDAPPEPEAPLLPEPPLEELLAPLLLEVDPELPVPLLELVDVVPLEAPLEPPFDVPPPELDPFPPDVPLVTSSEKPASAGPSSATNAEPPHCAALTTKAAAPKAKASLEFIKRALQHHRLPRPAPFVERKRCTHAGRRA